MRSEKAIEKAIEKSGLRGGNGLRWPWSGRARLDWRYAGKDIASANRRGLVNYVCAKHSVPRLDQILKGDSWRNSKKLQEKREGESSLQEKKGTFRNGM